MTAFGLKILAPFCMMIDHIEAAFPALALLRLQGRAAFPILSLLACGGLCVQKT
jgi:hypothetical protein